MTDKNEKPPQQINSSDWKVPSVYKGDIPFLTFHSDNPDGDRDLGKLWATGGKLSFEGDIEQSAKVFFDQVIAHNRAVMEADGIAQLKVKVALLNSYEKALADRNATIERINTQLEMLLNRVADVINNPEIAQAICCEALDEAAIIRQEELSND
jgi:hypothetical protein